VGIALVLLAGAGLLARSFSRLHEVSPGFQTHSAVAASVHLPRPRYTTSDQYITLARQATAQMASAPGVTAVAAATNLPFNDIANSWGTRGFAIEGRPPVDPADRPVASYYSVSPDYFRAMGVPLLRGRAFHDGDGPNAPRVAVISAALARKFFPDQDPLGQRLTLSMGPPGARTIVGVVGDVKPRSLNDGASLAVYEPFDQMPDNDIVFVVRTAGPIAALPDVLRTSLARVDPDQPFNEILPLTRLVADSLARQRFALTLFAVFSAVALLLAATGVYGVMAHAVAERRAEIGIRMALGAQAGDVLRLVLGQGGRLIGGGLLAGLAGALALTRFLETLLFGIGARDPLTLVAIAALLAAVATVACLLPARRASRVDPMAALRVE
jgi:putative ABC transport system permease protein